MKYVLLGEIGLDPAGKKTLDVGCGGGILAEEFARLGCEVTGIDPSEKSLDAARAHAAGAGLRIEYRAGAGENLPFGEGTFDIVYCCDVLEHVDDYRKVVAEAARVLKPGGVYFYSSINRTLRSWLVFIKMLQDWRWTRVMPPGVHDWEMFLKPGDLASVLAGHGMENRGLRGIHPRAGLLATARILRDLNRDWIGYAESTRRMGLAEGGDVSMMYMGYAVKPGPGGASPPTPRGSSPFSRPEPLTPPRPTCGAARRWRRWSTRRCAG